MHDELDRIEHEIDELRASLTEGDTPEPARVRRIARTSRAESERIASRAGRVAPVSSAAEIRSLADARARRAPRTTAPGVRSRDEDGPPDAA